ncbi:lysylphosphatidylglycerol synthase transmembrane domain-containing protein [Saccharothrix obliqua]|uniref:lysylphosphatidylglycerol synthase transmembrane domain-containing protein n=1 Tax=Saccharothrix obliqua TaxID=2861747 RepID=UPI001C5F4738|nr:lysylphosphatidylglycerol synthase transmembrane domain-containing protein [Saccharothrix obliqua]MBW4715992.1 flippase-like domain-containing protein [Saccharothrix obliqua]
MTSDTRMISDPMTDTPGTTGAHAARPARGRTWLRVLASLASLALAGWLVVAMVPTVGGVDWAAIGDQLRGVGPVALIGLTALWLAGLWAYTYVLTGSLPGLRNTQAFTLNAAGSAVSNLLPFGGAAGVAVTAVMAAGWGHRARAIATSTIVSGLWNALGRVALPVVALAIQGAAVLGHGVLAATVTTAAVLLAVTIVLTRLRWLSGVLRGRARRFVVRLRRQNAEVVRDGWVRMTLGMIAYLVLQALLLWCCLAVTGTNLGLPALIAAFAVSRLLTLAVITPGGFGVSENGTIALLVALGTPAAPAVAGVLLFALFTFLLEIPLGGIAWLNWTVRRARSA